MSEVPPLKIDCAKCQSRFDVSELEPLSVFACPICGAELHVPMRFDRYILEDICGSGSSTTVYRAFDTHLSRLVAVKVLENSPDGEGELGGRFLAEAKLVARLNHPGILPVYNCGVCEGKPYLVTRYMAQGDLYAMQKRRALPPAGRLLEIVAVVADALWYMYRTANVVHHDVKPSNIMLAEGNEVRLGDFDLADVREQGDDSPCLGWGSPAYISPERLYSGGEDMRGDVFSLGASLYELLCGKPPFGVEGSVNELYERRREMVFPELNSFRPDLPYELSDLVSHMLDFEPDCRPEYPEIIRVLRSAAAGL